VSAKFKSFFNLFVKLLQLPRHSNFRGKIQLVLVEIHGVENNFISFVCVEFFLFHKMDVDSTHFDLEHGGYDSSNALVLPSKRIKTPKPTIPKRKVRILSKKQRKKLEMIVEKRGKKQNRAELLQELQKHQLPKSVYDSFTPLVRIQTAGLKKLFAESGKSKGLRIYKEPKQKEEEDEETDPQSIESSDVEEKDPETVELVSDGTDSDVDEASKVTDPASVTAFEDDDATVPDISENLVERTYVPRPHCHVKVNRTKEIELVRSKLPIIPEEQVIMEAINENLVTILAGETGSGKTTQVPQFLYEAGYANAPKLIGKFLDMKLEGSSCCSLHSLFDSCRDYRAEESGCNCNGQSSWEGTEHVPSGSFLSN